MPHNPEVGVGSVGVLHYFAGGLEEAGVSLVKFASLISLASSNSGLDLTSAAKAVPQLAVIAALKRCAAQKRYGWNSHD